MLNKIDILVLTVMSAFTFLADPFYAGEVSEGNIHAAQKPMDRMLPVEELQDDDGF